MSKIRLYNPEMNALVNQMLENKEGLSSEDVKKVIQTVTEDKSLSFSEKYSFYKMITLESVGTSVFESKEVRSEVQNFLRSFSASPDATNVFVDAVRDGLITHAEAQSIRTSLDSVSGSKQVSLKALMGAYSPSMEPGANDLLSDIYGNSAPQGSLDWKTLPGRKGQSLSLQENGSFDLQGNLSNQ